MRYKDTRHTAATAMSGCLFNIHRLMKNSFLLCCFAAASLVSAAKAPDFSFPETVITEATGQLSKAQHAGDSQDMIDAIVKISIAKTHISGDFMPEAITMVDSTAKASPDRVAKSLLYSLEADMYLALYNNNRRVFATRDELADTVPADVTEWSRGNFVDKIGYTTYDALNEFALLESAVREDLNERATRVSAILNPVKLIITNYPEGQVEELEAINNPERPEDGTHLIEFSRELWMERDDFMEIAPKKYFRMTPGQEVRLKNAYIVKCTGCKKNDAGEVTEVYAEYDPDSKSGLPGANRKVKGTLHWVSCGHCLEAEVRLYDRLWKVENPRDALAAIREEKNCDALTAMKENINPDSLNILPHCYVEKFVQGMKPLTYLQFQRIGYFNVDKDSTQEKMVFNRTVGLKDTWSKINK